MKGDASVQNAWTTLGRGNSSEPQPPQNVHHQNIPASAQNFCGKLIKTEGNAEFWGCQNICFCGKYQ